MRQIGFTGRSDPVPTAQREALQNYLQFRGMSGREMAIHHGVCIGADAEADMIALQLHWYRIWHPGCGPGGSSPMSAQWLLGPPDRLHDVKPYMERNDDIVEAAHDLIAVPKGPEVLRSGTWATVRRARKKGIPITIIWPDGRNSRE